MWVAASLIRKYCTFCIFKASVLDGLLRILIWLQQMEDIHDADWQTRDRVTNKLQPQRDYWFQLWGLRLIWRQSGSVSHLSYSRWDIIVEREMQGQNIWLSWSESGIRYLHYRFDRVNNEKKDNSLGFTYLLYKLSFLTSGTILLYIVPSTLICDSIPSLISTASLNRDVRADSTPRDLIKVKTRQSLCSPC